MKRQFFFAQKAFIHHDGQLLAIHKSANDPNQADKWEVPGGRMDFGEDVDAHICREVFEETGIAISPGRPFYVWQWQLKRMDPHSNEEIQMQIVAVARICTPKSLVLDTKGQVTDDFIAGCSWVPIPELRNYNWITNMLPVVEAFKELPEIAGTKH